MTLKSRITAVDRFIKGCREDGIYGDLNACCVMAGWDSLAGALTPLKGPAPTNSGFIATDYDRGIGLTGDSTSYLDSNRAANADDEEDAHLAVFASTAAGSGLRSFIANARSWIAKDDTNMYLRINSGASPFVALPNANMFIGSSRSDASNSSYRISQATETVSSSSIAPTSDSTVLYRQLAGTQGNDATIAYYSIGSATDLALLDARVSTLMADLRAIEEAGFDRDAISYIRAVEEADGGAYLETDVKIAINNLVSGLKADGLWDAIGSSCLLSGPRTLAGALVPLKGDAPTPNGFVSGDHSRTDGLRDPEGTSYLDSNRPASADEKDSQHMAVYATSIESVTTGGFPRLIGYRDSATSDMTNIYLNQTTGAVFQSRSTTSYTATPTRLTGLYGVSRSSSGYYDGRVSQVDYNNGVGASLGVSNLDTFIFAYNSDGAPTRPSKSTIAFYSIGSHIDSLALLESHVSAYVTAIGAAI